MQWCCFICGFQTFEMKISLKRSQTRQSSPNNIVCVQALYFHLLASVREAVYVRIQIVLTI